MGIGYDNPFILEEFQLMTETLMAPLCNEKDQSNSLQILTATLMKMNELSSNNMVIFNSSNYENMINLT